MSKRIDKDMAAIREEMAVLTRNAIVSDLIEKNIRLETELFVVQAKYLRLARIVVAFLSPTNENYDLWTEALRLKKLPESEW